MTDERKKTDIATVRWIHTHNKKEIDRLIDSTLAILIEERVLKPLDLTEHNIKCISGIVGLIFHNGFEAGEKMPNK